jgi:hypothetical protein
MMTLLHEAPRRFLVRRLPTPPNPIGAQARRPRRLPPHEPPGLSRSDKSSDLDALAARKALLKITPPRRAHRPRRITADGQWYLPDPQRPGKYLMASQVCPTDAIKRRGLLIETDPEGFLKRILTNDTKERLAGLLLDDILVCEIVRYGIYNDEKMIAPLQKLYSRVIAEGMTKDLRRIVYNHIVAFVESRTVVSPNALLPFISEDPSSGIVATAVIDYVSIADVTDGDPMSRPRDIVGMIESGMLETPGAAFGGLLHLGDPRVCKLIWPLRNALDPASGLRQRPQRRGRPGRCASPGLRVPASCHP